MDAIKLCWLCLLTTGCGISYYGKIAQHHFDILWRAVPIEEALASKDLSQKQKDNLALVPVVKKFAEDQLGLKKTKNYEKFSQLRSDSVSYVVNATEPFSLEPYRWWYPVVGNLSYKGFPQKSDAEELAEELRQQGLDVHVRGVSAYSSLGWFADPVLSSMIDRSSLYLVDLIFHESTHAHLYIRSNAEFNEQLATFVGGKATEAFFATYQPSYTEKLQQINQDRKTFLLFLAAEKEKLRQLYNSSIFQKLSTSERRQAKSRALKALQERFAMQVQPTLRALNYSDILSPDLNNADLALYASYNYNQDLFEKLLQRQQGDLRLFLQHMKTYEQETNPLARLQKEIREIP